jgi:tetratricopeptide (TPR) repeat protein
MDRNNDLATAVRQRDVDAIIRMMFDGRPPEPRPGFQTETELWDYKGNCPSAERTSAAAWAEIAVDVLAFHNQSGGVIVFGIRDQDYRFCGASNRLDSKLVNDQLRKFLSDRIWVEFHRVAIQSDQRYLGLALIPPRGPILERFQGSAPVVNGVRRFEIGDSAIREKDSSRVLKRADANEYARKIAVPTLGRIYAVDEPFFRILSPDYSEFVFREVACKEVETALTDRRSAVASIIGVGGVGKTALATWAALEAYDRKQFGFIASITAKDRELTLSGIQALEPPLTSFESLLNAILDVLGLADAKSTGTEEKEKAVRSLISNSNGLLYVDNLETVDDARIIQFLDSLPEGVRALTTSRRTSVRISVHPVTLAELRSDEVIQFIRSLADIPGFTFAGNLSPAERERIGAACDGLPLAIRWVLSRCKSAAEAISLAEKITVSEKHGEELLEFCFRRLFDAMNGPEQAILEVLSLFQRPVPAEALLVGAGVPQFKLIDSTEDLIADGVIQRLFDADRNDYSYTLLPITRAFVRNHLARQRGLEDKIRGRLADWYEARDIRDPSERVVIREVRQGKGASDSALIDLALGAERRGDLDSARALYEQALQRNPSSWKAARLFAEFYRHKQPKLTEALRLYELAAGNAPSRGEERALIYREWGMILRDSGDPEATDKAIRNFEIALTETPNDVVAIHALAAMLARKGAYKRVIELLEPLANHQNRKTRDFALPLLLKAYEETSELLKATELRNRGIRAWN